VVEAAPAVVFRSGDESSCHGITVDVLDFLDEFSGGEGEEASNSVCQNLSREPFRSLEDSPLRTLRNEARVRVSGSLVRRWTCSGIRT